MSPHHHFANFFKKKEEEAIQPYAYAVSRNLAHGSVCIDLNDKDGAADIFEGYKEMDLEMDISTATDVLMDTALVAKGGEVEVMDKPFVLNGDNFYITRYFNYETQIISGIKNLINTGTGEKVQRLERLKDSKEFKKLVESRDKKLTTDWQLVASALAYLNNFTIITGGPGTGKTTTVAKILSLLYEANPNLNVKLAAPTGKAAMRMKEALATNDQVPEDYRENINLLKPYTLHRLLGSIHLSPYFKHNRDNKIDADVIIVDEASMIDVALFAKFINAVAPETRLIILGDQDQLTSVEAGSLLGDLCNTVHAKNHFSVEASGNLQEILAGIEFYPAAEEKAVLQDHIVELQHSYRFDKNPEFREVSEAVINNDKETIQSWFDENPLEGNIKIDLEHKESIFTAFIKEYENYIDTNKKSSEERIEESLKKFNDLRILAVLRNGKQGVSGLNARVEKYLASKGLINPKFEFYDHRPVIVTRNHPDLQLFNGDIGLVRIDPKDSNKMKIWFLTAEQKADQDDPEKTRSAVRGYSPGLLTDVETVFAMTVHKSQGSEFNKVLMVMPKSEDVPILTRELLYTGITRAKKNLTIQGNKEVILKSAKAQVRRASGIANRL
jgi:exodeoxyribonuclease V alpha subunit